MDFLIFKVPMLMVQASLDGILLGILFAQSRVCKSFLLILFLLGVALAALGAAFLVITSFGFLPFGGLLCKPCRSL